MHLQPVDLQPPGAGRLPAREIAPPAAPLARPNALPESRSADTAAISDAKFLNLKFDLFYEKVLTSGGQASFLQGERARSVSYDLYQRVRAKFSFDLTAFARLAHQTGRAGSLDEEVFNRFAEAASQLTDFNPGSLNTFLDQVDEVFNSFEDALGLQRDGLDGFAALIKEGAKGFFQRVTDLVASFRSRETAAQESFQTALRDLLRPPEDKQDDLGKLDTALRSAGVPEQMRASLLKLVRLVSRLDKNAGEERSPLNNTLKALTGKIAAAAPGKGDDAVGATKQPVALRVATYRKSVERVRISMMQARRVETTA